MIQLYIIPYIDIISNTKNKKQPVSLVIMSVVFCLFVCFISKHDADYESGRRSKANMGQAGLMLF